MAKGKMALAEALVMFQEHNEIGLTRYFPGGR